MNKIVWQPLLFLDTELLPRDIKLQILATWIMVAATVEGKFSLIFD